MNIIRKWIYRREVKAYLEAFDAEAPAKTLKNRMKREALEEVLRALS